MSCNDSLITQDTNGPLGGRNEATFSKGCSSRLSQFTIGTEHLAPRSHLVSRQEMGIKTSKTEVLQTPSAINLGQGVK